MKEAAVLRLFMDIKKLIGEPIPELIEEAILSNQELVNEIIESAQNLSEPIDINEYLARLMHAKPDKT